MSLLFDENISCMSTLQLADWLVACRTAIKKENFDTDSEYYEALTAFCDKWCKHYKQCEEFYNSKKFYSVLVYTTVKDNINLVTKAGKEVVSCPIGSCEALKKVTIDRGGTINAIENMTDYFYDWLYNIFAEENYESYKEELHEYISTYRFSSLSFERYFTKDLATRIRANTYVELEEVCNQIPHTVAVSVNYKRNNYEKGLAEYDIIKSVYSYFRGFNKCEKEFSKKLFVNLAFALGLPLNYLELLLEYNGYSISEKSHRKFDQIIRKAFQCGFSREMTIDLIEIENKNGYNVPNLTSNSTKG